MSTDRVVLTVPAQAEFARTVRMTASALVSRTAMTYDEVDDVRIAAEEAFVYAVDHSADSSDIGVEFMLGEDALEMRVGLTGASRATDEEVERRAAYATFILESVCDAYELGTDDDGQYVRVLKRAASERSDAEI